LNVRSRAPPLVVYSQRVLLIRLTLSSHSTCTRLRPFGVKASESEAIRCVGGQQHWYSASGRLKSQSEMSMR